MEWYQWVFSGVGGTILVAIIGFITKEIFNKSSSNTGIKIGGNNTGDISIGDNSNITKIKIISDKKESDYIQSSIEKIELSEIIIKITSPRENTSFPHHVPVKGTIQNYSSDYEIWLFKEPHKGNYHPDRGPVSVSNNQWFSTAYIGNAEQFTDQGKKFLIHVVAAPHSTGIKYNEYINNAHKTGNWSGLPSLFDGVIKDSVCVIRRDY